MIATSSIMWIIFTITSLFVIFRYGTSTFHVFSDQGIPGPKPVPFIGTAWGMWRQNLPDHDRKMAVKYGNVFGTFEGIKPTLRINDTRLIQSIFIKDFDHFINRRKFHVPEFKVFRYMLITLENQLWKDVRSAISPAFTVGKIKRYSVEMKECADKLCHHFHSIAAGQGQLDLKQEMTIYTMSVIVKYTCGITIDNLAENLFIEKAKKLFSPPECKSPAIMFAYILPDVLFGYLVDWLFNFDDWNFFTNMMENVVSQRSKTTKKYHDFLELALESISSYTKKENGQTIPMWNKQKVDEIVAGQATNAILAGYDSTANLLTASLFVLARHPKIQERIYELITSKMDHYEDVCREMIQDIPYVDQFMNEVLRMHPPVTTLDRRCNKDVTYNRIHISEGMNVSVSTYALHYSEEYYTDPETFNPDRWSPENKIKLDPYAFMPFGLGPRNCVALRFAQEEMKLMLCTLIKQFRFVPTEDTPMAFTVENGFYGVIQPMKIIVGIRSRI